jgi:hypothetical protein
LGDHPQLVGGRGAIAEEFEICRDLFEQHVCSDLVKAAAPRYSFEQGRQLRGQYYVSDEGVASEARRVERKRVADRHAERCRVYHQPEPRRIVVSQADV